MKVPPQTLTMPELRREWQRVFGWAPPPSTKRPFMEAHLNYQRQVEVRGGLSKATLRQLADIAAQCAKSPDAPVLTPTTYKTGTRLIRVYQGRTHEVTLMPEGYLYEGTAYKSLSAIARHITGTAWNGKTFFGMKSHA